MRKTKIKIDKKWLIIYTEGLYPAEFDKFKKMLGDPMKVRWYVFPSEYVKKVELIGRWKLSDYVHLIVKKIKRWLYR